MNAGSSQIRILTVDDHPAVRQGIAGLLAVQHGISLVAKRPTDREAIQQFRAHPPDVTLMDLQMPEMNGIDALIAMAERFFFGDRTSPSAVSWFRCFIDHE